MRRFLAAMALTGGAHLTAAEPDDLVRRLVDPSFAVRDAAAKDLLKLGGAALPAVRAARDSTDNPALRERTEAILPRLERLADSERLLAPKLLKIDYRGIPLTQAVEDLKTRTGIPLQLVSEQVAQLSRPVTFAGEFPPWVAIEKLCAAAGLKEDHRAELPLPKGTPVQAQQYYDSRFSSIAASANRFYTPSTAPILLVDGKAPPLAGSRSSNVRVLALPASYAANRVVRGAGTVVFHLDVAPLPGMNWAGANKVRVIRAEDEDGRPLFADERSTSLAPAAPPFSGMQWGGGGIWIQDGTSSTIVLQSAAQNPRQTAVTLRTDDRAIKTLRRLDGVVVGEVRRPNESIIVVDDMAASVGRSFDGPYGFKLSINDRTVNETGGVTVKVRAEMHQAWILQGALARDQQLANEMNIGNVQNRLAFYDAAGRKCRAPQQRRASYSGSNWTQSYDAELYFPPLTPPADGAGPPVKLVVTGTQIATIEVPFTMENVRLP
jgi:hypothetical protein